MSDPAMDAFFALHAGLPRQGPGEAEDVAWASALAGLRKDGRVADMGCGPGADITALRAAVPDGQVWACDTHPGFVDQARARYVADPAINVVTADMSAPPGQFDLIWCAGAVYFLGLDQALRLWRDHLSSWGAIAFSEPCYFVDAPSEGARAFWDGEGVNVKTQAAIVAAVDAAGYTVLGTRVVSDQAWENYYEPLEARANALRPEASPLMVETIKDARREMQSWRAHREETGYLLCVVRPR